MDEADVRQAPRAGEGLHRAAGARRGVGLAASATSSTRAWSRAPAGSPAPTSPAGTCSTSSPAATSRADGTIEAAEVREGDVCPRVRLGARDRARHRDRPHLPARPQVRRGARPQGARRERQARQVVTMGSYGIGVSRAVAAIAEQSYDELGLCWPREVAPADVHLVATGKDDAVYDARRGGSPRDLEAAGLRVIYDDRRQASPGVKFKDSELLGVPTIVVVGKGLADGVDRAQGPRAPASAPRWRSADALDRDRRRLPRMSRRRPVDAVVFDWGGTLTPWHNIDLVAQWYAYAQVYDPVARRRARAAALRRRGVALEAPARERGRRGHRAPRPRLRAGRRRHRVVAARRGDGGLPRGVGPAHPHRPRRRAAARGRCAPTACKVGVLSNTMWPRSPPRGGLRARRRAAPHRRRGLHQRDARREAARRRVPRRDAGGRRHRPGARRLRRRPAVGRRPRRAAGGHARDPRAALGHPGRTSRCPSTSPPTPS